MKSSLRIIIGVLVAIAVLVGTASALGLILRHFHVSFTKAQYDKASFVAGCIDNSVYIVFGVLLIFLLPQQIKRKLASGQITEEKAKKTSKIALPFGGFLIVYGILRIAGVL